MTTPINFEVAKLLKEKGFDEKCSHYYIDNFQNFKHDGKLYKTGLPNGWDNDNILQFVNRTNQPHLCNAPTIAEVVMWFYEKYTIWIFVASKTSEDKNIFIPHGRTVPDTIKNGLIVDLIPYTAKDSPTEAYEAAIIYVLSKLI